MARTGTQRTLLCFSHLRWNFVYQRPQHLLSRAARDYRVFFIEEPIHDGDTDPHLRIEPQACGVTVVTPVLPHGRDFNEVLRPFLAARANEELILWYYTPMARAFSGDLPAQLIVYDCMDELSAFKFAPAELRAHEAELFKAADVVFTGGHSLYQAKREQHPSVHAFPSSVDAAHFRKARGAGLPDPADQAAIAHPRLGFFGVIDERLDVELVGRMADLRPDWSFVIIGPVVKIDPATLPQRPNIHWLGGRSYDQLPNYMAHWDVGFMPFALNESTRFISPTKTPEFLAAGLPVVSSAITDVVRPYGERGLVEIGRSPEDFVAKAEVLLSRPRETWLRDVDAFLATISWDQTWSEMHGVMRQAMRRTRSPLTASISNSTIGGDHAAL